MALEHKKEEVHQENLPLCCPPIEVKAWGFHPRVYLTPAENGEVRCPYCSTLYVVATDKTDERV